ncbi:uncharacterized protein LOC100834638 isoform X2 [Brachypodium distachyon]|uniref:uncharacterized protein LOC100834638 isoform X2 n=1 Tax=Brachypodium distachyon TaxID=15368 RepID=UPI000530085D|nr:uncharacterized protein LOC100834638 isoform X2 [Brachypodium distachyon]|eukprot:XP_010235587.1 uncharacterized protein LOC100834638 isoform X2 [Brachypodium distachyon]
MDRAVPVRKPHASTAGLLSWSENGPETAAAATPPPSSRPSLKPAGGITPAMFGAPVTEQEAEDLSKRKMCSGSKMKEITGSGIFAAHSENGDSETGPGASNPPNKTSQTLTGISQISFSAEGAVSPKKPSSLPEVAKQRELSGTLESEADAKIKKLNSEAKSKELSGSDIFGPPPEIPARPLAARNLELKGNLDFALPPPRSIHTSVKVSNPAGGPSNIMFGEETEVKSTKKIHNQKFQELTGNNIFKEDAPPGSAEKSLSNAKLKEMSGSNIFADGKATSRDYFGGVRKPPGGGSSIALV